jgi:hypothetical protein
MWKGWRGSGIRIWDGGCVMGEDYTFEKSVCIILIMSRFKAKLIHDPRFYRYQWYTMLLGLLGSAISGVLIGTSVVFIDDSSSANDLWFFLIVFFTWIPDIFLRTRYAKKLRKAYGSNKIEISIAEIKIGDRIINTSSISNVLVVDPDTTIKQVESAGNIFRMIRGKVYPLFISLKVNGKWERFDYLFESHYMVNQLKKVLDHWERNGINIELEREYIENVSDYPESALST